MLEILHDYLALFLVGSWPNGPLGGVAVTLVLSVLGLVMSFPIAVLIGLAHVSPWRWLVTGEQNIRDHLPDSPALFAATVVLAAFGLFIVLREERREAWWRFQLYALAVSVVPAALTVNDFPQLRLVAFPVFLHVLVAPAVARMSRGGRLRVAL